MQKNLKKLLYGLKGLTGNTDKEFGYEYGQDRFLLEDGKTAYDFSFCTDEIGALMQKLIDEKYISLTKPHHFKLEYRAIHNRYASWEVFKLFLLKSIIVPIFVAFITALITSNIRVSQRLNSQPSVSMTAIP